MSGIENPTVTSDGQEYTILGEVSDNDYEWASVAILRREPDGQLFWGEDGGCSCYSFGDDLRVEPIYSIAEGLRKVEPLDREAMERSLAAGGWAEYR
jgi:hypothetical protein